MTTPTSGAADLPEALRVPLDSLHADAGYLCGRLLNGSLTQEQVVESIRRRIDAAKLAALTAQAISKAPDHIPEVGNMVAQAISKAPDHIPEVGNMVAQAISAEPAGAGYAALPDAKTLGEAVAAWIGVETRGAHNWVDTTVDRLGFAVRSVVGDMLRASHGQASSQAADFTTLGAAMRAIQQAIGLIGAPKDERMRAVRRVLRGAVVVAEDSGDIPALPAPPAMDGGEDAERWEFRWLNPANNLHVAPSDLGWKTVNSKGMRSEKEVLEDLQAYRHQGKPVYEVRPLFATRALEKPEIRCPVRLANGGDCLRHNLQCGWPDCNKETK